MDLKLVKKLLDLISDSDVDEVSIEEGEFKLKVKKNTESASPAMHYQLPAQPQQPAAAPEPPSQPTASAGSPEQSSEEDASGTQPNGETVKSPIVGTYYEAASPDSDPFIQVGDHIDKGQTLCIVEAMKIMNEIDAEFSGTIQKILVENGQPVEFDQPLFIIKKD